MKKMQFFSKKLHFFIEFFEDKEMADMVLNHISEDLHTWAVNLSREKFERDRISAFTYARETGLKEGLALGLKQGMEQGIAEGSRSAKIEDARNFLRMGLSKEQVAQGTGLTLEEIQKL